YLGLGHPRTVALRATISLKPDIALAFPFTGGQATALLDWRYGTLVRQNEDGFTNTPARVGNKPVLAFGPPEAAWVLDAPDGGAPAVTTALAAFSAAEAPRDFFIAAAADPAHRRLAYTTIDRVRFLTWGATGAPATDGVEVNPMIAPHALAFSLDGTKLLVGD